MITQKNKTRLLWVAILSIPLALGVWMIVDKVQRDARPTFEELQPLMDQDTSMLEDMWCMAYRAYGAKSYDAQDAMTRFRGHETGLRACMTEGLKYKDISELGRTQLVTLLTRRLAKCAAGPRCVQRTHQIAQNVANKGLMWGNEPIPAELLSLFEAHIASLHTTCASGCEVALLNMAARTGLRDPLKVHTQKALATQLVMRWAPAEALPLGPQAFASAIHEISAFSTGVRATLKELSKAQRAPIERDPTLAGTLAGASVLRSTLDHVPWMRASWLYVKTSTTWKNVSFEGHNDNMLRVLIGTQGQPFIALHTKTALHVREEEILGAMHLGSSTSATPDEAREAFLSRVSASPQDVDGKGSFLVIGEFEPAEQAMIAAWAAHHAATREAFVANVDAHLEPSYIKPGERSTHRNKMLSSFDDSYYEFALSQGIALTRPKKPVIVKPTYASPSSTSSSSTSSGVGYVPSSRRSVRSYSPTTRRSSYSSGGYRSGKN